MREIPLSVVIFLMGFMFFVLSPFLALWSTSSGILAFFVGLITVFVGVAVHKNGD